MVRSTHSARLRRGGKVGHRVEPEVGDLDHLLDVLRRPGADALVTVAGDHLTRGLGGEGVVDRPLVAPGHHRRDLRLHHPQHGRVDVADAHRLERVTELVGDLSAEQRSQRVLGRSVLGVGAGGLVVGHGASFAGAVLPGVPGLTG